MPARFQFFTSETGPTDQWEFGNYLNVDSQTSPMVQICGDWVAQLISPIRSRLNGFLAHKVMHHQRSANDFLDLAVVALPNSNIGQLHSVCHLEALNHNSSYDIP